MGRPLTKLPRARILKEVEKLRGRNNRTWMRLVEIATSTPKGRKLYLQIAETDMSISKWMSRI